MSNAYKASEKTAVKLAPYMKKAEVIVVLIALLSVILKIVDDNFPTVLLILSSMSLSIVYYFMAFTPVADKSALYRFTYKVSFWGLCILVLGFLFHYNRYPGSDVMMNMGAGIVGLCFLLSLVNLFKASGSTGKEMIHLVRLAIAILVFILFTIEDPRAISEEELEQIRMERSVE